MLATYPPFLRIEVSYAVRGTATITWEMSPHFLSPEPWTFQLQVGEADIASDSTVFSNVGSPIFGSQNLQTTDSQARAFGKESLVFYRVMLTTSAAPPDNVYFSPPANVLGDLDFHSWNLMQEMVRKDLLRLQRLKVGVPGLLLKNKRSGTPCTRCTNPFTQEQTDGACPVCFGQRFVGGFYQAQGNVFIDMGLSGNYPHQELQTSGTVDPLPVTTGHFVGIPTVNTFDAWCNLTSDLRYYLHPKKVAAHIRGVPFVYEMEMRLAPFSDVLYLVPLP